MELVFQIPLMLMLLFGGVQIGRVFYTYHMLQTAIRGGAGLLSRSLNVDYCAADFSFADARADARNFIVYGNIQGAGNPVIPGLTPDMIQILPERQPAGTTNLNQCVCGADVDSCDLTSGGRAPDFVTVNLLSGYPLAIPFPFINLGSVTLHVSVRMPVTGG